MNYNFGSVPLFNRSLILIVNYGDTFDNLSYFLLLGTDPFDDICQRAQRLLGGSLGLWPAGRAITAET